MPIMMMSLVVTTAFMIAKMIAEATVRSMALMIVLTAMMAMMIAKADGNTTTVATLTKIWVILHQAKD